MAVPRRSRFPVTNIPQSTEAQLSSRDPSKTDITFPTERFPVPRHMAVPCTTPTGWSPAPLYRIPKMVPYSKSSNRYIFSSRDTVSAQLLFRQQGELCDLFQFPSRAVSSTYSISPLRLVHRCCVGELSQLCNFPSPLTCLTCVLFPAGGPLSPMPFPQPFDLSHLCHLPRRRTCLTCAISPAGGPVSPVPSPQPEGLSHLCRGPSAPAGPGRGTARLASRTAPGWWPRTAP